MIEAWILVGVACGVAGLTIGLAWGWYRSSRRIESDSERPTDFDLMQVTANHQSARIRLLRENQDLQIAIAGLMKEREELFRELRRRAN